MSVDPDLVEGPPPHHRLGLVALVVVGGAVGAALRYALANAIPTATRVFPTATFVTNLTGALALGLLLGALARSGPDTGRRRGLRLLLGTGVLGAFTTYSTMAVETDELVRDHCYGLAAGYCLASVVAGVLLAGAGLAATRLR